MIPNDKLILLSQLNNSIIRSNLIFFLSFRQSARVCVCVCFLR